MTLYVYKHFISEADQPPSFSSEELKKFEKRFDNGYNLKHDERYNLWLKHFHGASTAVIAEGIVYIDCLASYTLHTKSVFD